MKWLFGSANGVIGRSVKIIAKIGPTHVKDNQIIGTERKHNRKVAKIARQSRKNNRGR